MDRIEHGTAAIWFSGESKRDGRGAVMTYIPVKGAEEERTVGHFSNYVVAYLNWSAGTGWHLDRILGMTRPEFLALTSGEASLAVAN